LKFDLSKATTRNAFVPRLWASRKIARLVEIITEAGAESYSSYSSSISSSNAVAFNSTGRRSPATHGGQNDPKLKELVDEIIRLSTEFGVLTEYTAFLATDGTDLNDMVALNTRARESLVNNAQNVRSGMGSVSQASNNSTQISQSSANRSNGYYTQNMERVEITTVQQITDRTFFKRNNRWVDATALKKEAAKPDRVVEFGTPEFYKLVDQLVRDGREGILALSGELLLVVDGKTVLIKTPPK
jgi:Ca-activated chloride channel family protein